MKTIFCISKAGLGLFVAGIVSDWRMPLKASSYHKVGMSTKKGSKSGQGETGIARPEDYIFRNSLKFTRTFFPLSLPFVFVRVAFNRTRVWLGGIIRRMRSGL